MWSFVCKVGVMKKVIFAILIGLLLLILGSLTFTIIQPTAQIAEKQDLVEAPLKKFNLEKPVETVDSELLAHEDDFLRTIKSCIPGKDKQCGMFISEKVGKQRIAVISPPGRMGDMLWKAIQKVTKQHEKVLSKTTPFELLPGSHVPPYG